MNIRIHCTVLALIVSVAVSAAPARASLADLAGEAVDQLVRGRQFAAVATEQVCETAALIITRSSHWQHANPRAEVDALALSAYASIDQLDRILTAYQRYLPAGDAKRLKQLGTDYTNTVRKLEGGTELDALRAACVGYLNQIEAIAHSWR